MKSRLLIWIFAVAIGLAAGCRTIPREAGSSVGERFEFALIGDLPYGDEATTNGFPNLIDDINRARGLAFVIHDGDIKSGSTPCLDEFYLTVLNLFQRFNAPLIYLPGDNEWSDCGAVAARPRDPLERLDKLRAMFCAGDESLGRLRLRLQRQSEDPRHAAFRENVRWTRGGVVFAGLNVPGADNHVGTPEYAGRNAANLAWLRETFALARREELRGVLIAMQANPNYDKAATNRARAGFNDLLRALEEETVALGKPVVLVHGDTHYYRIDQPMISAVSGRRVEHFTRVETFGNPDAHWIRATVDPRDPNLFSFRPEYVRKNLIDHRRKTAASRMIGAAR